jgi:serine/threonine protein kinase
VAVKVFKKFDMKEKDIEAIRTEIENMQKMDHPNIVKLLEVYDDD